MAGAKIVVLYPPPTDIDKFEHDYAQDHAPMVTPQNFEGITKSVASKDRRHTGRESAALPPHR